MSERPNDSMGRHGSVPGDWWYYAAAFWMYAHQSNLIALGMPTGSEITYTVYTSSDDDPPLIERGTIRFSGESSQTEIHVTYATPLDRAFWFDITETFRALGAMVRLYRRNALGQQFTDLLDEYYVRRSRGEKLKLKDLADEAKVNYDSLRQAKIRYDAKRQKDVS